MNETEFEYKGTKLTAQWEYTVEQDDELIDGSFDFGDADENAKYLARFSEGGDLGSYNVRVSVRFEMFEGSDSICACHLPHYDLDNSVQDMIKDHAMLESAIDDLKSSISMAAEAIEKIGGAS